MAGDLPPPFNNTMNKDIPIKKIMEKATKAYVSRQHGKDNHAPEISLQDDWLVFKYPNGREVRKRRVALDIDTAKAEADLRRTLFALQIPRPVMTEATKRELIREELGRTETLRLFGWWLFAAASGLTLTVWLCVNYGLL
jgi:hypothetical protein